MPSSVPATAPVLRVVEPALLAHQLNRYHDWMTNLIERIVAGIIRQEGQPSDSTNPGMLRDCPWFPMDGKDQHGRFSRVYPDGSAVSFETKGVSGQFWNPRIRAEGISGCAHVVALHIAEGHTLRQLITSYCPPSDRNNKTEVYIANVSTWADIPDVSVPLWNLLSAPLAADAAPASAHPSGSDTFGAAR